jgi:uncharacterized protein (TIGR03083 family)
MAASAQTIYKLIHKDGKVTYSESEPKNFDGKVVPMNVNPDANTVPMPKMPQAGAKGEPPPGGEINQPIWDAWNAKSPTDQVRDSLEVNASFLDAVDALSEAERASWQLEVFGTQQDLTSFLRMRLSEHTVHTWDVTVALDPASTLPEDGAALVADTIGMVVGWAGKPSDEPASVEVRTTSPEWAYHLDLGPSGASLSPSLDDTAAAELSLPTEAFVRLVYGRLDPDHTPASTTATGVDLDALRKVFPGL